MGKNLDLLRSSKDLALFQSLFPLVSVLGVGLGTLGSSLLGYANLNPRALPANNPPSVEKRIEAHPYLYRPLMEQRRAMSLQEKENELYRKALKEKQSEDVYHQEFENLNNGRQSGVNKQLANLLRNSRVTKG